MRLPRDEHEFTAQIVRLDRAGTPEKVAALCRAMLDSGRLPERMNRAELLCELGEHLGRAEDHQAAGEAFRAAHADGGPTSIDPRCFLARWCFEHGDPAEAEELLCELWQQARRDIGVSVYVGALYEDRGDLATAIRWLSAGAVYAERHFEAESPLEIVRLLLARRRVRRAQGFVDDDLDELADEMQVRVLSSLLAEFDAA